MYIIWKMAQCFLDMYICHLKAIMLDCHNISSRTCISYSPHVLTIFSTISGHLPQSPLKKFGKILFKFTGENFMLFTHLNYIEPITTDLEK